MARAFIIPLEMFPAHAGMSRGAPGYIGGAPNVPRTRGDEPMFLLLMFLIV